MAKCRDCDDEILETEAMLSKLLEDLCQSCRLDRVLNDLIEYRWKPVNGTMGTWTEPARGEDPPPAP